MGETNPTGLIRQAQTLYEARNLDAALAKLDQALEADRNRPAPSGDGEGGLDVSTVYLARGIVLTDLERYMEARVAYRQAAAAITQTIEATTDESSRELARLFNERGLARVLSGDPLPSLEDFRKATTLRDWYPEPFKNSGRVLLFLGRYEEARRSYQAADRPPMFDGKVYLGLARVDLATDDAELAVAEADQAISFGERSASLYLVLARALRAASRPEDDVVAKLRIAIAKCEQEVAERRDRPAALYLLAHTHLELGQYGQAAASFAKAIDLLKAADADSSRLFLAYTGYGHALSMAERFDEALTACREALSCAPLAGEQREKEQRENSMATLAYVLSRVGDVDEAASLIDAARDAASHGGRLSGSAASTAKFTGRHSWGILGTEAIVRLAAAEKYRDSDSWRVAVDAFERAVAAAGDRVRPAETAAYGGLLLGEGYARWHLGDLRGAADAFKKAKDTLPVGSPAYFQADKAKQRATTEFRLPRWLPQVTTGAALVVVAVATVLEGFQRLSAGAWASVVLGLALLAFASWCLPVIKTLNIMGSGFTKEVSASENVPIAPFSPTPTTGNPTPNDFPRPTWDQPDTPRQYVSAEQSWSSAGAADALPEAEDLAKAVAQANNASAAEGNKVVRRALREASLYALGEEAGEESDLLHYTLDDPETRREVVLLPVFTGMKAIREAMLRNPEWQTLSVLQLNGRELDDNVDSEVHIVINPGEAEYRLPSKDEMDRE